jgi:hypothetical protein
MLKGLVIWAVSLSINGTEVTQIGPMSDWISCEDMRKTVQTSVENSFKTETTYGVSVDAWGIGGGAIMRYSDYKFECVKEVIQ